MHAEVIAFISGKGGTGKSTSAVYIGGALAMLQKRVLLIELDSGLRGVDIIAGVSGQAVFDLKDVVAGRCPPEKAIVASPAYPGLFIMPAPYQGSTITSAELRAVCDQLRSKFHYILLDAAAGLGSAFVAATGVAWRLLLVLTPDPVALRDGRMIVDETVEKNPNIRLIINKVNPERIAREGVLRDLDEAIDTVGAQLIGVIPESLAITRSSANGAPLPSMGPERAVYSAIARRIIGADVPLIVR